MFFPYLFFHLSSRAPPEKPRLSINSLPARIQDLQSIYGVKKQRKPHEAVDIIWEPHVSKERKEVALKGETPLAPVIKVELGATPEVNNLTIRQQAMLAATTKVRCPDLEVATRG
jgi:hypothetical protein